MFTGLIRALGVVQALTDRQIALTVQGFPIALGDSIAVNGVCLTVAASMAGGFRADVSPETWSRSNLGQLSPGSIVNVEPALAVGDRVGGHFVSGHIDGIGTLRSVSESEGSWWLDFWAPTPIGRYLITKGSIAVNGISLTVARCDAGFEVAVIPHTYFHTNLQYLKPGSDVNLEVDMLAKYVEKLLLPHGAKEDSITLEFLTAHGYV